MKLGESQSELKLRTFESDRLQLLYEENLKSLKATQMETEKLQKKNDVRFVSLERSMRIVGVV